MQRASQTAQNVAAYRLSFERVPFADGDPEADERLARDIASDIAVDGTTLMSRYLQARTVAFDRTVVQAIEHGVGQIVALGAGYDLRSRRYGADDVQWFEADHPVTQADKLERLDRLNVDVHDVRFVSADFADDDLATALLAAGFDVKMQTLFLCEGVLVYLAPDVARSFLEQVHSVAASDSRLAISVRTKHTSAERRAAFDERVKEMGEPALFGNSDALELLPETGWTPLDVSEGADRIGFVIAETNRPTS